jgi:hypothetical protein
MLRLSFMYKRIKLIQIEKRNFINSLASSKIIELLFFYQVFNKKKLKFKKRNLKEWNSKIWRKNTFASP